MYTSFSLLQNIFCTHYSHINIAFSQKVFCTQYPCKKFLRRLALQKNVCLLSSQVCMKIFCSYYSGIHAQKIQNFSLTCLFHSHRTFSVHIFLTKTTHSCRNFPVHIILTESFLYTIFLQRIFCRDWPYRKMSAYCLVR